MLNPFLEINWRPGTPELRKFALTLLGCLLAIGLVLSVAVFGYGRESLMVYLKATAAAVGVMAVGLFLPRALLCLYYPWFALGAAVGLVVGNMLLLFFYYTFFSLYALGLHFTGKTAKFMRPGWRDCGEKTLESYFRQH